MNRSGKAMLDREEIKQLMQLLVEQMFCGGYKTGKAILVNVINRHSGTPYPHLRRS